jgi:peptide deformylase
MPELPRGTVRTVVRAPDPVLSTPGADVDPKGQSTVELAAQQVGVAARMFSVDVSGHPKTRTCHGALVLCNAEVVSATQKERGREGCMSVPDFTGDVARARRLVVRGQLPVTGEWVEITTDGFEAVALQHEIDHTAGLLFLDRVTRPNGIHPRRTYL